MDKNTLSEDNTESLIKQARHAFSSRQPELFHEAFSQNCKEYVSEKNGLDCLNCGLVVPYSPEMLEEAINLFRKTI